MGFLTPLALWALPLAAVPFLLERSGRRRGEPVRFSSLYLVERARRLARRNPARSRWRALLRAAVIALLVLAAARPVAPGRGDPALHRPTRAIVAVDVSASVGQRVAGRSVWDGIRGAADSLLALTGPDDRVALAAVADGVVGWWEGPPIALRRRLAALAPTARASDWPAVDAALAAREDKGTETYLLTDGARGARGPVAEGPARAARRVVRAWAGESGPNRALAGARWTGPDAVALAGAAWGPDAPATATAGRLDAGRVADPAAIPLAGGEWGGAWAVADTATFTLADPDRLPADDRWYVARGGSGARPRAVRWAPADEPPEPGPLFWEAALEAAPGGGRVERVATLGELARRAPDLALLPIRAYRTDQAALLSDLAAAGTRLLFAPACAEAACAPPSGWMPAGGPAVPDLAWRLAPADRQTALAGRPGGPDAPPGAVVPGHLLARVPVRGSLAPARGPAPDWTWDLASGAPALWARGPVALWLVPLGPPVTRLATTPVFPLVAEAALAAWAPAAAGAGGIRAGRPLPVGPDGGTVTGPLGGDAPPTTWRVASGGRPPRPERPGIYRVVAAGDVRAGAGEAIFVAVNGDPEEGDLTPIPASAWRAGWSAEPVAEDGWRDALFPRRRGPELWPWALALALAGLVAEAALRRTPARDRDSHG